MTAIGVRGPSKPLPEPVCQVLPPSVRAHQCLCAAWLLVPLGPPSARCPKCRARWAVRDALVERVR